MKGWCLRTVVRLFIDRYRVHDVRLDANTYAFQVVLLEWDSFRSVVDVACNWVCSPCRTLSRQSS